jgi:hypothetical protein
MESNRQGMARLHLLKEANQAAAGKEISREEIIAKSKEREEREFKQLG